jgi:hypothetical protein
MGQDEHGSGELKTGVVFQSPNPMGYMRYSCRLLFFKAFSEWHVLATTLCPDFAGTQVLVDPIETTN